MTGRGMDLERTDNRFGFQYGLQSFANTVVQVNCPKWCNDRAYSASRRAEAATF